MHQALAIAGQKQARWFAGHFDPLLAGHVRMLNDVAAADETLIVQITDPPQPLLSRRARAELVAGLSAVHYVVIDAEVSADDVPDAGVREEFIAGVRRRATGAGA